ncbi:MAG: efflux transporter outer membrane subunit [Syntrophobacteraceae bacterium]|nr:efflux transporter outer membrane subunit [Syntrophobacteraceae bacterium]
MSKLVIAILAALFALSGCTMIPVYERPAVGVARQFPGLESSRKSMAATRTPASCKPGPGADIAWRNFFTDNRLKKLIELALANNRDMRTAVLNIEKSRAQYRVTRSASFPEVDASGNYTRSKTSLAGYALGGYGTGGNGSFTSGQWSASLGATAYEVDLWGRVSSLNREALEKYFATVEAGRSEQIGMVSEVATQYFTLREAEEELELSRRTLCAVRESYKLNKASFDAGASNELDLRQAQAQVQTAAINVVTFERQIAEAQNYLTLLIGCPLPANLPAPGGFMDRNLVAGIPAGLPSELLERRPDILEAEHTLKAANADIGAMRAAFFPAIELTGSVGSSSSELSQLFGAGTGVWSFSPQITLPIFTGGKNLANLDAAKVGKRIEIVAYQKAVQTAFREVADALAGVSSYERQTREEEALVLAQQKRYELANASYRQGNDTYLSVLTAQEDLFSAQQGLIQAGFNELAARISLYKALGGGWK